MNDNEKVICEKCGSEMAYFMKVGSCGFSCPNCCWGWATTYHSPLDLDEQKYTVTVENSNEGDSQKYKTISEILGCNYLEARKKLISGFSISEISAKETVSVLRALTAGQISFKVTPDFPHDFLNQ